MKTYLKVSLFIFIGILFQKTAYSQGNLQFNKILFYNLTVSNTVNFTVPAGKVWKVESAGCFDSGGNVLLKDSANKYIGYLASNSSPSYSMKLPMWLPSGGEFNILYSGNSNYAGFVSIIEFNIVP